MSSISGYFVTRPIKELSFNTGKLAGQYFPVPQGFVLSVEEVESWPERAFRVAVGPDGYLSPTSADPSDVKELVAAAGSSMGVAGEGDGVTTDAVPAPNDNPVVVEVEPDESPTTAANGTFPQHEGGGVYLLSDGSKAKGRAKAIAAEAALGA